MIGERADAVILAFAGTDPGVWQNLLTDFTPLPQDGSDIHNGFRVAAKAARQDIAKAIALSNGTGKPLFITGHSLGAALAALAAQQASAASAKPGAVYGFGMPRSAARNSGQIMMRIWVTLPTGWCTATTWSRAYRRSDC